MEFGNKTAISLGLAGVLFAGGCSAELASPEQTPIVSISPSPEYTKPIPESTELLPYVDLADACDDAIVQQDMEIPGQISIESLTQEFSSLSPEQLLQTQQDNLGILGTTTKIVDQLNPSGSIETPNFHQDGLSFAHTIDADTGTVMMEEWDFSQDRFCQISSITKAVLLATEKNYLTVTLGTERYDFDITDEMAIQMADGSELSAEAVAVTYALAGKYFSIVSDPGVKELYGAIPSQENTDNLIDV